MRTKIIVLGIIGVIVFIMLYFIYLILPKKEQENGDEVKLRSEIKSGYTVDEMIKEVKKDTKRNQYEEPEPDSSNEEDLRAKNRKRSFTQSKEKKTICQRYCH